MSIRAYKFIEMTQMEGYCFSCPHL